MVVIYSFLQGVILFYFLTVIYTVKDNSDLIIKALFEKPYTALLDHESGLRVSYYKMLDEMTCKHCNQSKCLLVREFNGHEDLICMYCSFDNFRKEISIELGCNESINKELSYKEIEYIIEKCNQRYLDNLHSNGEMLPEEYGSLSK